LALFKDLEFIKEKDLIKLQEKRLRNIIHFAYRETRLYHDKLKVAGLFPDDIKTLDDLKKIPFSKTLRVLLEKLITFIKSTPHLERLEREKRLFFLQKMIGMTFTFLKIPDA
jgi:hypothetical protein